MKKHLINFMFTALTFGMLMSLNTMAAENKPENDITINESGGVSLTSENAKTEGINAFQLSLKVETDEDAEVAFNFNQDNDIKVMEYRYHPDTKTLNLYVADEKTVFNSDLLDIGEVNATTGNGEDVDFKVSVEKNSLKLVSQNNITEKEFTIDGELDTTTTTTMETTTESTTTTTAINSFEISQSIPSNYQIVIPESTNNFNEGQNLTLRAENVWIESGQMFEIAVTSENNWYLMDKNTKNPNGIRYHISCNSLPDITENQTATVLTINDDTKIKEANLKVTSVDDATSAGTFADTLTFSVQITG